MSRLRNTKTTRRGERVNAWTAPAADRVAPGTHEDRLAGLLVEATAVAGQRPDQGEARAQAWGAGAGVLRNQDTLEATTRRAQGPLSSAVATTRQAYGGVRHAKTEAGPGPTARVERVTSTATAIQARDGAAEMEARRVERNRIAQRQAAALRRQAR